MVAAGLDGVGSRAVGRERELEPRGLCHLRDDNRLRRNGPQGEQGERRGTVDAAVLAFVDLFGIGGGARTTGAAGVDGVGFGFVDRDRELDPRCLGHLRDCDRLARKGAQGSSIQEGRGKPPLFAFADGFGIVGGSTTGVAGGTASAAEMSGEGGSSTFEVYVDCATVTG